MKLQHICIDFGIVFFRRNLIKCRKLNKDDVDSKNKDYRERSLMLPTH